jgi:hypothetical protein
MKVRYGWPPRIDELAGLRPGASTAADVLLVLGEPRGRGTARIARGEPTRDLWFYEYVEARGQDIGLTMLLIFFDGERYVGYLWFSTERPTPHSARAISDGAATPGRAS